MFKIIVWSICMAISIQAIELKILVDKVDAFRGGSVVVYIYGEEGFPKDHSKALLQQTQSAIYKELDFTFQLPSHLKEIAIKVHHDENGDTKVTKNWTGIYPKEGLGFSNKQTLGMFGPPVYKNSKISLEDISDTVKISLSYP